MGGVEVLRSALFPCSSALVGLTLCVIHEFWTSQAGDTHSLDMQGLSSTSPQWLREQSAMGIHVDARALYTLEHKASAYKQV